VCVAECGVMGKWVLENERTKREREREREEWGRKGGRWGHGEVEALTALQVNPSPTQA
jgi:hypothetical protein